IKKERLKQYLIIKHSPRRSRPFGIQFAPTLLRSAFTSLRSLFSALRSVHSALILRLSIHICLKLPLILYCSMKQLVPVLGAALAITAFTSAACQKDMKYPQTKKGDAADTFFGKVVPDPYSWLEDDRSSETANWVTEQNKLTGSYLSQIPFR